MRTYQNYEINRNKLSRQYLSYFFNLFSFSARNLLSIKAIIYSKHNQNFIYLVFTLNLRRLRVRLRSVFSIPHFFIYVYQKMKEIVRNKFLS